jgi:HAD superfamily hydrolase (TIGR01509 family)
MPRWELVIFDNDGVLVDSETLANSVLASLLEEYGWPLGEAGCVQRFLGTSLAEVRADAEAHLGRRLPDDFEDRYHRALFGAFPTELTAIPFAGEAVDRVAGAGSQVCVASSGSRARIRLALRVTGLADRFDDRLFSAEEVGAGKPAPDLFLTAARTLGATAQACAVVEDSPLGVAAARAAGMRSFAYAARTPADALAGADAVFADMRELPALLGVPV